MHNTIHFRDTEDGMCIILVLLRRADGVNRNFNVRNYNMPSQDINIQPKSKNGQKHQNENNRLSNTNPTNHRGTTW